MSIVAPISATGVAIPVFVGLLSGERPGALQVAGMVLACGGVVLASREAPAADARRAAPAARRWCSRCWPPSASARSSPASTVRRRPATSPGCCSARASPTSRCWWPRPRSSARGCRAAPRALGAIAAIGVFDLLANLLFVLATGRGLLSVVGVLGSLYPAVTVVLARFVLHERLSRAQNAGVLITLAGVVALAAG